MKCIFGKSRIKIGIMLNSESKRVQKNRGNNQQDNLIVDLTVKMKVYQGNTGKKEDVRSKFLEIIRYKKMEYLTCNNWVASVRFLSIITLMCLLISI